LDVRAQARHYPLETTDGLRLHEATAVTATLDGKKGVRLTVAQAASTGKSTAQQPRRPFAMIEASISQAA
jgi:hypothetical protein